MADGCGKFAEVSSLSPFTDLCLANLLRNAIYCRGCRQELIFASAQAADSGIIDDTVHRICFAVFVFRVDGLVLGVFYVSVPILVLKA